MGYRRKRISTPKTVAIVVVVIAIASVIFYVWHHLSTSSLQEGDIVFQMSQSQESDLVSTATRSPWTHCGVIVEKGGRIYVLEAANVVKLTPFDEWKAKGKYEVVWHKRVVSKTVKLKYNDFLGIPYDSKVKLNNGRYYSSELVYFVFKNQFNIELAKPRPISTLHLTDEVNEALKERGIDPEQKVVPPCDL